MGKHKQRLLDLGCLWCGHSPCKCVRSELFTFVESEPAQEINTSLAESEARVSSFDPIQKPAHYAEGRKYEPIDVLMDWFSADPLLWQVGKYISRAGRKGSAVEDLEKAKWYLERKIQLLKEKG